MTNELDELNIKLQSITNDIVSINKKYNYSATNLRSEEDNLKFKKLWSAYYALIDAYNVKHPMPPCKSCGQTIEAYLGHCIDIGVCPNAPKCIGS